MNLDLFSRLALAWGAADVEHAAPATPEEIAAFETRYNVALPPDFRAYVQTLNGSKHGRDDMTTDQTIAFWRLDEIEPEEADGIRVFPFADFLIDSHRYLLALGPDSKAPAPVFIRHNNGRLVRITESFADFVRAYLEANDDVLHAEPTSSGPSA